MLTCFSFGRRFSRSGPLYKEISSATLLCDVVARGMKCAGNGFRGGAALMQAVAHKQGLPCFTHYVSGCEQIGNLQVCGTMTGGGSESNVSAVLASIAYMKATKNITQPEIIIAETAHASFWKAAKLARAKYDFPLCSCDV